MAFSAVQFAEHEGGTIALVNSKWLTPRKREVFWPPSKTQSQYLQILKNGTEPDEHTWKLYTISRLFFTSDDYDKSVQNLKILEDPSDISTEEETIDLNSSRPRKRPRRLLVEELFAYINGDDEDDLPPPPRNPQIVAKTRDPERREEETIDLNNSRPRKRPRRLLGEELFAYIKGDDEDVIPPSPRNSQIVAKTRDPERRDTSSPIRPSSSHSQTQSPSTQVQSPSCSPKSLTPSVSPSQFFVDDSEASLPEQAGVSAFQIEILKALKFIQEQNSQIITLLKKHSSSLNSMNKVYILPEDLPVTLPIGSVNELNTFENYLQDNQHMSDLVTYFSTLGGKDTVGQINRILKRLLTNQFASEYSFYGKRGEKRAFSGLKMKQLVIGAIKLSSPQSKEKNIEDGIKVWLKHSPQRYKTELLKQNRHL